MRFRNYFRRNLKTGTVTNVPFNPSHFSEAGLSRMSEMPLLEAYQLVNKWNASRNKPIFMYYL